MRATVLLSALVSLVVASPVALPNPQNIDFAQVKAAPTPTALGPPVGAVNQPPTYNPSSAAAAAYASAATDPVSLIKRQNVNDDCARQPDGYGPTSTPDTASAFLSDPQYLAIASAAPVPQGYAQAFTGLQGSTEGPGYMGLYTMNSFDTVLCQEHCDAAPACYAINVYMERDPSLNPAAGCDNPPSITNYKCTLWGTTITGDTATNVGQWRQNFHVVLAGSNGYNKLAPPPANAGFSGPSGLGGATQAPSGYIGMRFYPGVYDPSQCAAACVATTAYDKYHLVSASGTYDACNYFNSYVLSKNNEPLGTYCSMYTQPWDKSYGTNYGQYSGPDHYTVSQSYGYTLSPQDPGVISGP